MSDYESLGAPMLIAALVASGNDVSDVTLKKATNFLRTRGINGIQDLSRGDLEELGLTNAEEIGRILAAFELGRRAGGSNKGQKKKASRASDIARDFEYLRDENQEHLCAVFLDSQNGRLGTKTIHIGTLTMTVVSARDVFREALRLGASGVVVVHNHPSGDPSPSPEDIATTKKLSEGGKLIEVDIVDHIIIGHHSYFSFAEKKML
ncbi:MAG: DNA repair protein RadC [Chthonomonas sp.]|nr:DNA repair protein RadC [Chthonomonas sp.]